MAKGVMGIENVMKGLNQKLLEYEIGGIKGMKEAAGFIRGDMEKTSPKVPVDKNILRSSWFVSEVANIKTRIKSVFFGFSANYAIYVHENLTAINWKRPGSGPKFLEAAIKRNTFKILLIIRGKMTMGGKMK
ncbi:MAG: hypothetical protein KAS32_20620 [Candidatus Peribacteraceae bacterium]|nr:hypothetical protein [Candidatus Peribacteraceae bacterium]